MPASLRFVVPPEQSGRPLGAFLDTCGRVSREQAQDILKTGGVFVNRRRIKGPSHRVQGGDRIELHLLTAPQAAPPPSIPILYQDAELIIVAKPAGIPVEPTRQSDQGTLLDLVARQLAAAGGGRRSQMPRLRAAHRLDREVSGAVALTLSPDAARSLSAQLRDRSASRSYLAVVSGQPAPEARLIHRLTPDGRGGMTATACAEGEEPDREAPADRRSREAITRYLTLTQGPGHALLRVSLETGRTHQIRAQLAAARLPLVGDRRYRGAGPASPLPFHRPALHAASLSLRHPTTGAPLRCCAEIPEDLKALMAQLGFEVPAEP